MYIFIRLLMREVNYYNYTRRELGLEKLSSSHGPMGLRV